MNRATGYVVLAATVLIGVAGCSVDKAFQREQAEAEASRGGCLCVTSKCESTLSASGAAALTAETAGAARQIHRETKSK